MLQILTLSYWAIMSVLMNHQDQAQVLSYWEFLFTFFLYFDFFAKIVFYYICWSTKVESKPISSL
jgi:phosphate starvation-inducible membrane PsiE